LIDQLSSSGGIVTIIKRETRSRIEELRKCKSQILLLSILTTDDWVLRFLLAKKRSGNDENR